MVIQLVFAARREPRPLTGPLFTIRSDHIPTHARRLPECRRTRPLGDPVGATYGVRKSSDADSKPISALRETDLCRRGWVNAGAVFKKRAFSEMSYICVNLTVLN